MLERIFDAIVGKSYRKKALHQKLSQPSVSIEEIENILQQAPDNVLCGQPCKENGGKIRIITPLGIAAQKSSQEVLKLILHTTIQACRRHDRHPRNAFRSINFSRLAPERVRLLLDLHPDGLESIEVGHYYVQMQLRQPSHPILTAILERLAQRGNHISKDGRELLLPHALVGLASSSWRSVLEDALPELLDYLEPSCVVNQQGNTLLHLIFCSGHALPSWRVLKLIRLILKYDKDMLLIRNMQGHLPLHIALLNGYFPAVPLLLEQAPSSLNEQCCKTGLYPAWMAVSDIDVSYNLIRLNPSVVTSGISCKEL